MSTRPDLHRADVLARDEASRTPGLTVAEEVTALSAAFSGSDHSKRFLIFGATRGELAAALIEYRAYVAAKPDDDLSPFLRDTIRDVHTALHQERVVLRSIGWGEKPCEQVRR